MTKWKWRTDRKVETLTKKERLRWAAADCGANLESLEYQDMVRAYLRRLGAGSHWTW